jgi:hypothetical protein
MAAWELNPKDAAIASSRCEDLICGYPLRRAFFRVAIFEGENLTEAFSIRQSNVLVEVRRLRFDLDEHGR